MGSGELACYTVDGEKVWQYNVQDKYGKFDIQFGMASTPVLDNGRLYMQLLHSGGATVLAAAGCNRDGSGDLASDSQDQRPRRVRAVVRFADHLSRRQAGSSC